jgi:hypothetical protein
MIRLYLGKSIVRIRMILEKLFDVILLKMLLAFIRNDAHRVRKEVVKKKGREIVNRQVKKSIKEYARQRFGKAVYWPYLALYTEIRGEFIKGWLPYDYYRFILLPKMNPKPALYLCDQKTYDYRLFGDFAVKPIFLFISGIFYNTDLEVVTKSQVIHFLSDYDNIIVIKEEGGWGGEQVRIIHSSGFIPEELKGGKNYVIQPYVKQYKVLDDLYPDSVNTFRVNTFIKKDGSVVVKYVWLRFGSGGKKVDNLTSGGNYLYFDLNGKPENLIYDWVLGVEVGDRHKNTGYLFSDIKIPMFQEILEKCRDAHKKYPYVRLIAWDVCINSAGEPKLIEWNTNNPDFFSQEAKFGPFWTEDDEF